MVRLIAFLSALVIASTLLLLGLYGAERLPLIVQSHMHSHWFGTAGYLASFFGAVVVIVLCMKEGRAKRDEDVPLTPIVRRLPSGLREL